MATTGHDGGATRNAAAGTHSTRLADRTSPAAPRWARKPGRRPRGADNSPTGTTTMPAICASAISGIARKLSARPANVTREKSSAPTGNSIASVATDAVNIETAGFRNRGIRIQGWAGTIDRIASVAPKVRTKAGSTAENGWAPMRQAATNASALS